MILVYLKIGHPKIPWFITIRNFGSCWGLAVCPMSDRPHLDKLRSPATFDAQYLRIWSGQGPVGRCWVQGLLHRASSASCWLLNWCLLGSQTPFTWEVHCVTICGWMHLSLLSNQYWQDWQIDFGYYSKERPWTIQDGLREHLKWQGASEREPCRYTQNPFVTFISVSMCDIIERERERVLYPHINPCLPSYLHAYMIVHASFVWSVCEGMWYIHIWSIHPRF